MNAFELNDALNALMAKPFEAWTQDDVEVAELLIAAANAITDELEREGRVHLGRGVYAYRRLH